MRRVFVSHSYFATSSGPSLLSPRIEERPLEKDCANFGRRDAFALSPVIYVWHLGRVCSMTWHKYLHVKFFLAQVMPLTSVCLLSPTLSLACLLPSFSLKKKVIYFTLTLFTPLAAAPLLSTDSCAIIIISFWGLPWRQTKLMMMLIDGFCFALLSFALVLFFCSTCFYVFK